ncbi:hypothetical protein RNZ50_22405 [Paracoccaceae bacterium Fryx2]|nr:hypothetical protein [Paracoccaceae bacterium Fryx2]
MSDYRNTPPNTTNTTVNTPAAPERSGMGMVIGGVAVVAIIGLVAWNMMDNDRGGDTAPVSNTINNTSPAVTEPAAPAAPAPAPEAAAPAPAPEPMAPAPAPAPAPVN